MLLECKYVPLEQFHSSSTCVSPDMAARSALIFTLSALNKCAAMFTYNIYSCDVRGVTFPVVALFSTSCNGPFFITNQFTEQAFFREFIERRSRTSCEELEYSSAFAQFLSSQKNVMSAHLFYMLLLACPRTTIHTAFYLSW